MLLTEYAVIAGVSAAAVMVSHWATTTSASRKVKTDEANIFDFMVASYRHNHDTTKIGAGRGTRTPTGITPLRFECSASANSTIPASVRATPYVRAPGFEPPRPFGH